VTAAVEDQAANAHCSQIFDKRQTASTRSAPSVICRSPPARTAELSATLPSHPPGEWPTSANERYLLQKLSLFRVEAFFIADVGNGCAAKYLSDITAYFEFTFSTVKSRTLTLLILVRIQVPQPGILLKSLRICSFLARRNSLASYFLVSAITGIATKFPWVHVESRSPSRWRTCLRDYP
jgi:hypothetical protein